MHAFLWVLVVIYGFVLALNLHTLAQSDQVRRAILVRKAAVPIDRTCDVVGVLITAAIFALSCYFACH